MAPFPQVASKTDDRATAINAILPNGIYEQPKGRIKKMAAFQF